MVAGSCWQLRKAPAVCPCRDALANHTPRQLRLMFALHAWHKPMVYDANALKGALDTEATLRNFFRTTNALLRLRKLEGVASVARWHVRLWLRMMSAACGAAGSVSNEELMHMTQDEQHEQDGVQCAGKFGPTSAHKPVTGNKQRHVLTFNHLM